MTEELEHVQTQVDATRALMHIREIEEEIEQIKDSWGQHNQFFRQRIEQKERQIGFWKGKLEAFLEAQGSKTLALPSGTLKFRNTPRVSWPSDEDLIAFSKENGIPTRMKETPDKNELKEFIKETGNYPHGYHVENETSFYVTTSADD